MVIPYLSSIVGAYPHHKKLPTKQIIRANGPTTTGPHPQTQAQDKGGTSVQVGGDRLGRPAGDAFQVNFNPEF